MDAADAAAIMQEMTGDTDIVSKILLCMKANRELPYWQRWTLYMQENLQR